MRKVLVFIFCFSLFAFDFPGINLLGIEKNSVAQSVSNNLEIDVQDSQDVFDDILLDRYFFELTRVRVAFHPFSSLFKPAPPGKIELPPI